VGPVHDREDFTVSPDCEVFAIKENSSPESGFAGLERCAVQVRCLGDGGGAGGDARTLVLRKLSSRSKHLFTGRLVFAGRLTMYILLERERESPARAGSGEKVHRLMGDGDDE
jgi:hypothetical protein